MIVIGTDKGSRTIRHRNQQQQQQEEEPDATQKLTHWFVLAFVEAVSLNFRREIKIGLVALRAIETVGEDDSQTDDCGGRRGALAASEERLYL